MLWYEEDMFSVVDCTIICEIKDRGNVYAHVWKGISRIKIYRLGNIVKVLKLIS